VWTGGVHARRKRANQSTQHSTAQHSTACPANPPGYKHTHHLFQAHTPLRVQTCRGAVSPQTCSHTLQTSAPSIRAAHAAVGCPTPARCAPVRAQPHAAATWFLASTVRSECCSNCACATSGGGPHSAELRVDEPLATGCEAAHCIHHTDCVAHDLCRIWACNRARDSRR